MSRNKKIAFAIALVFIIFIADRYIWMPNRVKQLWLQESGRNLGDPIAYDQDFTLKDSEIVFHGNRIANAFLTVMENRKSKFYFAGCYIGKLFIYDVNRNELIIYFSK